MCYSKRGTSTIHDPVVGARVVRCVDVPLEYRS